ncbi:MAG TPA: 16S rRNA (cytosine(1402)-N(4))-methyltransferase RsmH [Thermoanaerobaculia bacterium]|nr:16S rRNA (cytosine(1402)-N(4))-methyltransferase RsmH [Thermoanaerobaculia bacterium]
MDALHVPVLAREVVGLLEPGRGGTFVDVTLGLGGHAEQLLEARPDVRLVGVDRDPQALELAGQRLARFGERVRLAQGDFRHLAEILGDLGVGPLDGILADLGVSSLQLDRGERGFSIRRDGPLDMRMGPSGPTAREIVNRYPEAALEKIFRDYGEERQARAIARAIEKARREGPIETTGELAAIVHRVQRRKAPPRHGEPRIDPATRVFQALRIEVNQELSALPEMLDQAVNLLAADGRLVVISYHSLEDRIVKNTFRDLARGEVDEITGRPRSETQLIEVLTKHPIRPAPEEVEANPRSRSARLRAARRL